MKILAGADFHGSPDVYDWFAELAKSPDLDAVVLAGDLLGVPDDHDTVEQAQRADADSLLQALEPVGAPVLYIMGNDDFVELRPSRAGVQSIHMKRVDLAGYSFVGYQYSLPFMGGIFEKFESQIAEDLTEIEASVDERTVLVTHSPAYGTLDKGFLDRHIGSRSIASLIERCRPLLHIHGHSHSNFGRNGRHLNVASALHRRAMVIDLDGGSHEVLSGD